MMEEFQPTEESYIKRLIEEETRQPELGEVTKIFSRNQTDDNNFKANVKLRDSDKERRKVHIASPFVGAISIPEVGDTVIVDFLDGKGEVPVIVGKLHNAKDKAPLGQAGVYRLNKGNLYFEMDPNGNWVRMAKKSGDTAAPDAQIQLNSDGTTDITGASGHTEEDIEDIVSGLMVGGSNISLTYDDANNTLSIDTSALNEEQVEDTVSTLLSGGSNISLTYDDANNTLSINTTALNEEQVEDTVSTLLSGGSHISLTYDDTNDTLTIDSNAKQVAQSTQKASYITGHTEWGTTGSAEEVHRIDLQSGESFKPQRLGVQLKGGGSNTSFTVDVYDATNATTLLSTTAGSVATNGTESPDGVTILIRVDNATGSTQTATITANGGIR